MNCECHNEPAYWQKDKRLTAGGWWECAVKRRQRERDWYDRDPIHRITKRERQSARDRAATLTRRRAHHRTLQNQGRDRPTVEQDP